jgi:hypothetical protein
VALWAELYNVSLGYVALALVYLIALQVYGFTGGVYCLPCGYVALRAVCIVCPAGCSFVSCVMVSLES